MALRRSGQRRRQVREIPSEGLPHCLKVERAKLILGERWLLHPANRVKRVAPENPPVLALVRHHA